MNQAANAVVMELAKGAIDLMEGGHSQWERAFFRFSAEPGMTDGSGSYVANGKVELLSPLANRSFWAWFDGRGRELLQVLGKPSGVFLLIVTAEFDFRILYEWDDCKRWRITKLDGASGMPAGLEA
jgi:hypothetical protein